MNKQDNEDKTEDIKDVSDENTKASERGEAIKKPTYYDCDAGKGVMKREVDDNDTSKTSDSSDISSPNEQETHDNDDNNNLYMVIHDIKLPSPYEPCFDGN